MKRKKIILPLDYEDLLQLKQFSVVKKNKSLVKILFSLTKNQIFTENTYKKEKKQGRS